MGRYRPPPPPRSKYITQAGKEKLQAELDYLWSTKRPKITKAVQEAAAQGDRSENAEYIYRKKQLREIDRRIRYLQKRLPDLNVVTEVGNTEQIFFGARVTLEREDGSEVSYRIVGGDEIDSDSSKGYISVDSPMARAMLKKTVDDEIVLRRGDQESMFTVVAIDYT